LGGHGLHTGFGFSQQTGLGGHGLHTGLGGHGGGQGLQTGFGGQAGAHGFGHTGPCSQHDFSQVMWMWMQQILSLIFFNRQQSLLQQSTFACPQHPPIEPP
jgi:hypothetical protein